VRGGLDAQDRVEIESELVSLRGGIPVLNGAALGGSLGGWQAQAGVI
jgi:hypothetical protein